MKNLQMGKNNFEELLLTLRKCKDKCPWVKEQSVESYAKEALDEIREVLEAIEKKDYENLKEELGDLLWDILMIAHMAEDGNLFKVEDIMQSIVEKMKRRKPYIFEKKEVTLEEAEKIWHGVKAKEKLIK
jgi:uncharacterized protein YabN with tetrapyrrole methylase and pyrophosphatase domain